MAKDEIAILMAAGLGMRMRPLTERVPKPLVTVQGVPLIETVITALEQRKVKNIYVVVGYLKEQFSYLTKKYENVELIENKEYLKKNNISSVYAVGDILGSADCFICEADLYIPNPDVLLCEYSKSCYLGKMVKGYSDDWVFELGGTRLIRVGKGGKDLYNMVGVSYWRKQDALIIRKAIQEAYGRPDHEQLFWDEIVDANLSKMDATVQEVSAESIMEIDTVTELEMLENKLKQGGR